MVYCNAKECLLEASILDAMARKTETAKSLICNSNDVIFPGDYPKYIEA